MCVLCTEDPIDSVDRQVSKVELSLGSEQEPRLGLDPQPSTSDVMESGIWITNEFLSSQEIGHANKSHDKTSFSKQHWITKIQHVYKNVKWSKFLCIVILNQMIADFTIHNVFPDIFPSTFEIKI